MNEDRFRKLILFLILVIVVLTVFRQGVTVGLPPSGREVLELFRWTFSDIAPSIAREGNVAYVTRADVILALTTIVWFVWLVVRRQAARAATVSGVVYSLGVWPIVSLAFSWWFSKRGMVGGPAGVREVVQHFEYFVIAFALFGSVMSRASARRVLVFFLLVGAAAMGVGVYLVYSAMRGTPVLGGLGAKSIGFEGWASQARLAALLAPIFFGCAAFDTHLLRRIFWSAATVASLITCVSGPLLATAIVVILVLSMIKSERLFACLAIILLFLLPFSWVMRFGPVKEELAKGLWFEPAMRGISLEEQAKLRGEASAIAVAAIDENPLVGMGPGADMTPPSLSRYLGRSDSSEEARGALARAAGPPPYLLTAARMGIPMVLFFLWVFVLFSRRPLMMMTMPGEALHQGLGAGLFGAVLVFAVGNFWTPMVAHETGLPFALILACIWRMSEPERVEVVGPREAESRPERPSDDLTLDLS